ncbi:MULTISPECIES: hypothetical protein [Sulfolobaceae]|nr:MULTISPECIES: hypothetical protein [unclassified Sulfolobus]
MLDYFPNGFQQRRLIKLADITSKMWNEVNHEGRQQFFKKEKVDLKGT